MASAISWQLSSVAPCPVPWPFDPSGMRWGRELGAAGRMPQHGTVTPLVAITAQLLVCPDFFQAAVHHREDTEDAHVEKAQQRLRSLGDGDRFSLSVRLDRTNVSFDL
ncbi:hypothetical protein Q9966_010659 [Columba livia]|nr:hypothetical protein Q9966_010659 [Columba livia]